jgi:hypothetical protein
VARHRARRGAVNHASVVRDARVLLARAVIVSSAAPWREAGMQHLTTEMASQAHQTACHDGQEVRRDLDPWTIPSLPPVAGASSQQEHRRRNEGSVAVSRDGVGVTPELLDVISGEQSRRGGDQGRARSDVRERSAQ